MRSSGFCLQGAGAGPAVRGAGAGGRDWGLQAEAAAGRPARMVSWSLRCPRLLESSRDSTRLPRNVTVPVGRLRHPSPTPRLRRKRQGRERRSVGMCHHES